MEQFNNYMLSHSVIEFLSMLFWIAGCIIFLIGMCLLIADRATLRSIDKFNRRFPVLPSAKLRAESCDAQCTQNRHVRWLGLAFIAGAVYALHGLVTGADTAALLRVLNIDADFFVLSFWVIEWIRWALVAGNVFAVSAGLALMIYPKAFYILEKRNGVRVPIERSVLGSDDKNFTLDDWVATNPHIAASAIIVAGLVPMADFGAILFGIY